MRKFSNSLFAGAVLLGSALSAGALTSPLTADQTFTGEETVSGVKFTINSGVTLTVGDGVSSSTLTIENSGLNSSGSITTAGEPLANNGKIIVSKGSTLNVIRNDYVQWAEASVAGNIDIYGTLNTKYAEKSGSGSYDGYNLSVKADKTMNVYGALNYKNGAMAISTGYGSTNGGIVNLYGGSTTTVYKVVFNGSSSNGATLKIDGNAVFKKANGGNVDIVVGSSTRGSKIDLSTADAVAFGTMAVQNGSNFTFVLGNNVVTIDKLLVSGTPESLIFEDFKNNIFQIKDASNLSIIGGETLRVTNGSTIVDIALAKDTALAEGENWTITSEGFLNVVPEPAEYAAILGAIAIAFALKRRCSRK